MGEILGIGMTHAPHLQFTDENMANVLRRLLKSDRTPAEMKDPKNWPAGMRAEWGSDEGVSAARSHRAALLEGVRAARAALDAFKPDFVLIWGDDQYENFREDLLPPFCVYAFDEVDCALFKGSDGLGASANVWNEPANRVVKIKGHREAANLLAQKLLENGFDVAWSYRLHHAEVLSHAFARTILYLDYDRKGFPYPVIPFHVNCYGSHLQPSADQGKIDRRPAASIADALAMLRLGEAGCAHYRERPMAGGADRFIELVARDAHGQASLPVPGRGSRSATFRGIKGGTVRGVARVGPRADAFLGPARDAELGLSGGRHGRAQDFAAALR